MPYDEHLAGRIRALLEDERGVTERRMFGGIAFLLGGKMAVAASSKGGLMARVDPEETDALLTEPHVGPFEMRGKPIDGWLLVDDEGVETAADLRRWVERGAAYARTLI